MAGICVTRVDTVAGLETDVMIAKAYLVSEIEHCSY